MEHKSFRTKGGIAVERETWTGPYRREHDQLSGALDTRRGVLFSSSFEFPGRYTRLDMGFVDPPLVLTARGRAMTVEALNERGQVLLPAFAAAIAAMPGATIRASDAHRVAADIAEAAGRFPEEQRSRQPSVFSVLRGLIDMFASGDDEHLGFYGAFGYDLVYQFEPMALSQERADDQRDLVLYLPDEILITDHMRQMSAVYRYEFTVGGRVDRRQAAGERRGALRDGRCRPRRGSRRATTVPASMPHWCAGPRRRLPAATCSRSCSARCSPKPAPTRRARCSAGCARATRRPTAR